VRTRTNDVSGFQLPIACPSQSDSPQVRTFARLLPQLATPGLKRNFLRIAENHPQADIRDASLPRHGGTSRIHDRRVMPVECKVSNSEVNSFKRVNLEAAGKARAWLNLFGRKGIVPAAVLSGVFKPANLETAQAEGLSLFWGHRLSDLADFIRATKP